MDRRPQRSARRALALACVCALGITGCASIPRSGPVHVAEAPTAATGSPEPVQEFPGPTQDADPEQIVRDFLAAGQGADGDYAAARQFLTPDRAATWRPGDRTTVFSGAAGIQQGLEEDQVRVSLDARAQIDGRGIMARQESGSSEELDIQLEKIDGQWRISEVPNGVVVPADNLEKLYQPYNLYFLDPGGDYAVPDPRWFPDRPGVSTQLMRALLDGPSPSLEGAVQTAFPDAAQLVDGSAVPVQDGLAEVDLQIPEMDPMDTTTSREMYAQARLTLGELGTVDDVELSVDGTPLEVESLSPSDLPAGNVVVPSRQVALEGEELVYFQGGQISPVPEVADSLEGTDPAGPAMNRAGDAFAALTEAGAALVTFTPEDPEPAQRLTGSGLTDPSVDPRGWAWSADDSGTVRAVRPDDPEAAPLTVEASWLEGTPVTSLRLSRGGTRALIITDDGDATRLLIAGVVRGAEGRPVSLNEPYVVDTGGGHTVTEASWISDTEVVAAETGSGAAAPRVFEISGRSRSLPVLDTGVTHLSGGNGDSEIFVESEGRIRLLIGDSWSPQTEDVTEPSFAG